MHAYCFFLQLQFLSRVVELSLRILQLYCPKMLAIFPVQLIADLCIASAKNFVQFVSFEKVFVH